MLILTGCSKTVSFDGPGLTDAVPEIREYTKEEQLQVKSELTACGDGCKTTRAWMLDYVRLRKVIRATKPK